LGADFHSIRWGWDNEFPTNKAKVSAFQIAELPVTMGEYQEFVESGEYDNPNHWTESDFTWKQSVNLHHPTFWKKGSDGNWSFMTVFDDDLPLRKILDWPVYVSQAEATAYAKWKGKRLPTEAEFHRAAYGKVKNDAENKYPWGDRAPEPGVHGNFHMFSYAPMPVGSCPQGKSEFGVHELVGNGWEWTSTLFDGFPGFDNFIPDYQGYSKDFFDGRHYVLKGASCVTGIPLLRKSFRNWYQGRYPYPFAKFRLVSDSE